jgi:hypothetical protein
LHWGGVLGQPFAGVVYAFPEAHVPHFVAGIFRRADVALDTDVLLRTHAVKRGLVERESSRWEGGGRWERIWGLVVVVVMVVDLWL